jgi:hypothetical protein
MKSYISMKLPLETRTIFPTMERRSGTDTGAFDDIFSFSTKY